MRECGSSTVGNCAAPALRMRVNMSEIGSLILSFQLSSCVSAPAQLRNRQPARIKFSPTGLRHPGNQPVQRRLAERQARHTELAPIATTTAAHRAAVHHARWTGVARQLRQTGVIAFRLQFGADRGVFFHRFFFSVVPLYPCFLGHNKNYFSANGKPIIFRRSSPSSLFGAVVTIVMSMPCCRLILSSSISGKIVWSVTPNV